MTTAQQQSAEAAELAKNGVVAVPNYLSEDVCEDLRTLIERKLDADDLDVATDDMTYTDMATADHTILNQREGTRDHGVVFR